ncbi:DNA mismatch repair protein MutS [Pedobacter sp. L105]|uniref:MutS-related protein n=1 Tax=Pedobacter sp. L105 TaxID=1641871 RepID=UPI00131B8A2D|nr:DNA mismatch repair protein MutS [Pedobacter sp. L105]
MVKLKDSILKDYQNNVEIQHSLITKLKATLNTISYSRLGLFLLEILLVTIIILAGYHWYMGVLVCLPILVFIVILKRQVKVQNDLTYAEKLLFVFQNEVDLITMGHQKYDDGTAYVNESHSYASDLDIYGASSLYAFINRSNTVKGMKLLADSLGKAGDQNTIIKRQEAIFEVKEHIDATYHFRAGLQYHKPQQLEIIKYKIAHKISGQLEFTHNKLLRFYTILAPVLSVGVLIMGVIYEGIWWKFLGLCFFSNSAVAFYHQKNLKEVKAGFDSSSSLLSSLADTIAWTQGIAWKSSYIKDLFGTDIPNAPLTEQIKELSSFINALDASLNIFIGPFLQGFLLWDFKYAIKLDGWHIKSSKLLLSGLETISHFEELISFATLAHNQPEWIFPIIAGDFHFEATGLGHPLISDAKRVINDYQFEKIPTTDIVTGSNMAGKSTFLRTVGINMVLAFAGAPVCATAMKSSIFELLTYMRIKDSLNDQTSTFKAELNRLKMILGGVKALSHPLVLIDEMLRGTNSKDKYLGSKVFIQQMILEHTPTLFATHDLQLSEMIDSYSQELRNYHFDIQLTNGEMNFDYKLKYGACKTFNAALLLKEIGLEFNPDEHN